MRASQHGGHVPEAVGKWHVAESDCVEMWPHGPFDTREQAVAEGLALYGDDGFAIGLGAEIDVSGPDIGVALEQANEHAVEQCGEVAEDFLCHTTRAADDEIDTDLGELFAKWLTKHDLWPRFCKIENIERVEPTRGLA